MRRLERVEDLLPAVDVLAGASEPVLVDHGVLAGPVDVADAERLAQDQVTLDDRVIPEIEGANRRARGAVALRVVLTAVARTAEAAGREHRDKRHALAAAFVQPLPAAERRTVRLHRAPQVCAAVGDEREARLPIECAVVADVDRAMGDLSESRIK